MTIARPETEGVARWVAHVAPAADLASRIADTDFVPRSMRGNPAAIAACIMYGDEIGVSPMAALQGIHVIDGRPFLSSETMRGLVFAAGHQIVVIESTGTRCRVRGRRAGETEAVEIEWTMEMARAAGLAGKGAWRTYPRALLLARASAELCRILFPDVVRGLGRVPEVVPAEAVSDWAEYAETFGPDSTPEEPATERVQWNRAATAALGAPSGQTGQSDGPAAVPWGEDTAEAEKGPETAPAGLVNTPDKTGETPPAAEDEKTRMVNADTVKRIMAAYGDLPYGPDRTTRLALFSALLSRPVESTKDLDRLTAYRLLGALRSLREGRTIAIDDGHGGFDIHAGEEPPNEADE